MVMFSLDSVRRWLEQRFRRSLDAERCEVKRPRIEGRMRAAERLVTGDPAGDDVVLAAAELELTLLDSLPVA